MAYAVLVSLEQTIHQILNQDRYSTSPRERQLIISLDKYVISFQAFLEDFTEKSKNLEVRIRDVATAAEDIIECFMLEQTQPSYGCIVWMDGIARIKFDYELSKVAEKMESIAAEVVEMKNSITIEEKQLNDSSVASSSSGVAPSEEIEMVGFDDDLMEIKGRLLGESRKLQFLSIVGMGGIGKTTLAKNAFDDQSIQEYFQIRAWLTISQDYRDREILSSLLDSMKEFDHTGKRAADKSEQETSKSINEMADRVYKILNGRRYVIVMDDIWSTKVLDDVKKLFPDDGNGSRIMITTRLNDVAVYVDSSMPCYEMRLMDGNQSWNLFREKVFGHQNRASTPELEIIGKEIAMSCRRLPLAVVVIAGVVSTISKTPASWVKIAKNIKSAASNDERLEKILSLSYNHLPHRLRLCLLYMAAFPEDYPIRVSELGKLWIAEGFLKQKNESKSLEEGAEEYLEESYLVIKRKSNGKINSCSLHDMVRDTCIRLLKEENNLRLVMDKFLENTKKAGCMSMRSVMRFDDIEGPVEHFRLLRVLHVPKIICGFRWPPEKILMLSHLRYLAFSCYRVPSAISNFQNLESLVINVFTHSEMPSSIWKMRQLRHLIFKGRLPDPEEATSALENLQTLTEVHDLQYREFLLERTPNLRKLGVRTYSGESSSQRRHLSVSLVCLRQLEKLKISHHFLDAVPGCLQKCTLNGCVLSQHFLKVIGSLPNLQVLKLISCSPYSMSWVICRGEFPQLKFLLIDSLHITTLLIEDSSAFPRLKCLRLHGCYLEEISDDIGEIPTLELVEAKSCGIAVYDWARRIEEAQQDLENYTLQVRCIGGRSAYTG